jgi:hypothetical protein
MARAFLFGGWRDLGGDQLARPRNPALQGTWKAPFYEATGIGIATLNADLVAHGIYRIRLILTLQFQQAAPGSSDWRLTAHQPSQAASWLQIFPNTQAIPGATLAVRWGPIVRTDVLKDIGLSATDDLDIRFSPATITESQTLPIDVVHNGAIRLDLDALTLTFAAGALTAAVAAPFDVWVPPRYALPFPFFGSQIPADAVRCALDQNPNQLQLNFTARAAVAPLPLHADLFHRTAVSSDNPVLAPVLLHDYSLVTTFGANTKGTLRLLDAVASGANSATTGPRVVTEGWRDETNHPVAWRADRPLALHARSYTDNAPATFLIAPTPGGDAENAPLLAPDCPPGVLSMHSHVSETKHSITGQLRLVSPAQRRLATPTPPADAIDAAIASDATAPWLETDLARHQVGIAKAGHTYLTDAAVATSAVLVHQFPLSMNTPTPSVRLPVFPPVLLRAACPQLEQDHLGDLAHGLPITYPLGSTAHESQMLEKPSAGGTPVPLASLFTKSPDLPAPGPDAKLPPPKPVIDSYVLQRDYGVAAATHKQLPTADYALIDDLTEFTDPQKGTFKGISLAADASNSIAAPTLAAPKAPWPVALVKLTRRFRLIQIAQRENRLQGLTIGGLDFLTEIVHPQILGADWTGLILFQVPLNLGKFPIMASLIGEKPDPTKINFAYLALTPTKSGGTSITARIRYKSDDQAPDPTNDPLNETRLKTTLIDIEWFDSQLNSFKIEAELTFRGFLGLMHASGDERTLTIDGALDKETQTVRFLGNLSKPIEILPPNGSGFGPIKQVQLAGAEIVATAPQKAGDPWKTNIQLKGSIEPQNLDLSGIQFNPIQSISFDRLGIDLPTSGDTGKWQWLKIGYPTIRFDLNLPSFSLGAVALKLQSLGIGLDGYDWSKALRWVDNEMPSAGTQDAQRSLFSRLRLDLMRLPELSIVSFDRLSIDFPVALFPSGNVWSARNMRVYVGAFGFDNFQLDLMRFLRITARTVALKEKSYTDAGKTHSVPWLEFTDVDIEILGKRIVDGLTLAIFTTDEGKNGFLCYLPVAAGGGFLSVDWVLIGQNISVADDLAAKLVALSAADTKQDNDRIRQSIVDAVDSVAIVPRSSGSAVGEWLFAGGFSVCGDLLYGKFLFQDHRYYGICLQGGFFKRVFGLDIVFSALYIKAPSPAEDRFILSIRVPTVTLPAFTFFGGVITIDIAVNGSFTLDIGFPAPLSDGSRDWSRCFGTIVGYFQGSGGAYISKRTTLSLAGSNITFAGGYAAQFGLGASFGGAIFRVWVTAGVYGVLEGSFTFLNADSGSELVAVQLVGAVGILIRGVGELDWWIISVRIEVLASAEARTTITWAQNQPTYLRLDFNLTVRASAEACIGGGWFRICKGISVGLSIPFQQTLKLAG